jgi:hypothetical protein
MEWAVLTLEQAGGALIIYAHATPNLVTSAPIFAPNPHDRK